MGWGFERGRVYNRRGDIHGRFGGQQQGGIVTPSAFPLVIIITGEEGLAHGYADRMLPDGTFEYFGEGQVGGMTMTRGNAAIASHAEMGRDLLLFRKTPTGLRFEDMMIYAGHHMEQAPDRNGDLRQAIVFELRPLEAVEEATEKIEPSVGADLATMRMLAMEAAHPSPRSRGAKITVVERSRRVRDYVVARADGRCEGCNGAAPFLRANGVPYLEPHHIRRLGDGGPDDPHFVIGLCPNCHRRVHSGADGREYNAALLTRMAAIEPE